VKDLNSEQMRRGMTAKRIRLLCRGRG